MTLPDVIKYNGKEYIRVAALDVNVLKNQATALHDIAQMLRPSIASSDAAQSLDALRSALTNMVRANSLLLNESGLLPDSVPGNSERIYALTSSAVDAVASLSNRLHGLANKLGHWALKVDNHIKEKEYQKSLTPETQMKATEESRHFKHLW